MERPLASHFGAPTAGNSKGGTCRLDAAFTENHSTLLALTRSLLARERSGSSLEPFDLLHDFYLRARGGSATWPDRDAFLRYAAWTLKRLLIDRARRMRREKRRLHGQASPNAEVPIASPFETVSTNALLESYCHRTSPRRARITVMRMGLGLSVSEIAGALGVSNRTVIRECTAARRGLEAQLGAAAGLDRSSINQRHLLLRSCAAKQVGGLAP